MSAKRKLVSEIEARCLEVTPEIKEVQKLRVFNDDEDNNRWDEFLLGLMEKLPTCKFARDANNHKKVYVYLPSDLYAMGWVGCNDYRIEGSGTNTLGVYSHTITNDKYSSHNDQHHMLMSTNPKRAIKNALSHLRPYTPRELNHCFAYPVVRKVRDTNYENQEKVEDAQNAVTKHKQLQAELRAVVASGYQFVDADFGSKVTAFLSEVDEYALQTSEVHMFFVRAYMLNDQQMFDVTFLENAHNTWDYKVSTEPAERYTSDTLPEHLSGKLSVLMMCELDEYVDGVGIRMNDGVFYVNQ
jgi:hypothetical protein